MLKKVPRAPTSNMPFQRVTGTGQHVPMRQDRTICWFFDDMRLAVGRGPEYAEQHIAVLLLRVPLFLDCQS